MIAADAFFAPINFDAEVYKADDHDARIQAIRDAIGEQLALRPDHRPTWIAPASLSVVGLDEVICENYRILLRRIAELRADLDELTQPDPMTEAAPRLLAALKALREACVRADSIEELPAEVDGSLLDDASVAIALAEGRTS